MVTFLLVAQLLLGLNNIGGNVENLWQLRLLKTLRCCNSSWREKFEDLVQWVALCLIVANLERVDDGYKFKCATKGAYVVAQYIDNLRYSIQSR